MFQIDGEVAAPCFFDGRGFAAAFAHTTKVDVSQIDPRRSGTAVPLSDVLGLVEILPDATHATFHADDGFAASVSISLIRDRGLIIFALNDAPLPESAGGPLRFLVPDAESCRTAEVDACANVKNLTRIEITIGRGTDRRRA